MCSDRRRVKRQILWNYNQGDFLKARHMIDSTDWDSIFSDDVSIALQKWQSHFLYIMEQCIPKVSHSSGRLPWLTKSLMRLIKKKNSLFKAWKKEGNRAVYNNYKHVRNMVTKLLRSAKKNFFSNLNTMDQKVFWKTVHQLTNSSSSIPVLAQDSKKAFTSQEKADMLSEVFKKSFNSAIAPLTFADLEANLNSCPMYS